MDMVASCCGDKSRDVTVHRVAEGGRVGCGGKPDFGRTDHLACLRLLLSPPFRNEIRLQFHLPMFCVFNTDAGPSCIVSAGIDYDTPSSLPS